MKTIFLCLAILMFLVGGFAHADNEYTNSAHGSTTATGNYGVFRTSTSQYVKGHCAHCHEQHASIGGTEPAPNTDSTLSDPGPDKFCLLGNNFDTSATPGSYTQDDCACFYCHCDATATTLQNPAFNNYTYSETFGGYADATDSIMDAFNNTSYHNLNDVLNYADSVGAWPFTADSNPCSGCHNVHIAQRSGGKPSGSYVPTKSAISRPSDHNELWGDTDGSDDDERMDEYASGYTYQAPYRSGGVANGYEPDGSGTTDGSNLTNYVTFCLSCHSSALDSATLGTTTLINWDNSFHGKVNAAGDTERDAPYHSETGKDYVLACTDCHEPHGSYSYLYMIRKEVNGSTTAVTANTNAAWNTLCNNCHTFSHHSGKSCIACHYHGSLF